MQDSIASWFDICVEIFFPSHVRLPLKGKTEQKSIVVHSRYVSGLMIMQVGLYLCGGFGSGSNSEDKLSSGDLRAKKKKRKRGKVQYLDQNLLLLLRHGLQTL